MSSVALVQGMDLLTDYAYVAVFDADFKPEADFLERTIPYLEGNPDVSSKLLLSASATLLACSCSGLTQAPRWLAGCCIQGELLQFCCPCC